MNMEKLLGRHARLERELEIAFSAQPWSGARIERLADELAAAEVEIGNLQPATGSGDHGAATQMMLRSR